MINTARLFFLARALDDTQRQLSEAFDRVGTGLATGGGRDPAGAMPRGPQSIGETVQGAMGRPEGLSSAGDVAVPRELPNTFWGTTDDDRGDFSGRLDWNAAVRSV